MGVNSHVLQGDLVITRISGTQLYNEHPDDVLPEGGPINLVEGDDRLVLNLDEGEVCTVLSTSTATSALGPDHDYRTQIFLVWAMRVNKFGWLFGHTVRSYVTQRELPTYSYD